MRSHDDHTSGKPVRPDFLDGSGESDKLYSSPKNGCNGCNGRCRRPTCRPRSGPTSSPLAHSLALHAPSRTHGRWCASVHILRERVALAERGQRSRPRAAESSAHLHLHRARDAGGGGARAGGRAGSDAVCGVAGRFVLNLTRPGHRGRGQTAHTPLLRGDPWCDDGRSGGRRAPCRASVCVACVLRSPTRCRTLSTCEPAGVGERPHPMGAQLSVHYGRIDDGARPREAEGSDYWLERCPKGLEAARTSLPGRRGAGVGRFRPPLAQRRPAGIRPPWRRGL